MTRLSFGKKMQILLLVKSSEPRLHPEKEEYRSLARSPLTFKIVATRSLMTIFEQRTDATLAEYCELLYDETGLWVSQSTMCRTFFSAQFTSKKKLCAPVKQRVSESNS
jgi:transposase